MSIYCISDIHSCLTKFRKSIPSDCKKLIINGDLVNKGREQKETFQWIMKNANNPKYIFIRGNHEIRWHNELIRHYMPEKTSLYYDWFGTSSLYKNINITNVVIEMINNNEYKLEDVLNVLRNSFKWYHIEGKWIIAHASWELNKKPQSQSKVNIVYDTLNLLKKIRNKNEKINILPEYKKFNFVFGHIPIFHFSNQLYSPVILRDQFYYIDNGIFKTSRPVSYLKLT